LIDIFFGLLILDRIESPTATVTKRLHSNLGVNLAPAATHTPAIAADTLALSPLRPALAGCRGPSAGCCAAMSEASSEGSLGASLPAPHLYDLHRQSVFTVIAMDFIDNDARGSDLCAVVKDLANSTAVGLINRSGTRLRRVRPRARAFHRSSIGLPLRRPFRP
jgi:hypothetical protein